MFTTYVAEWLPDILVESSTGTRPSMTGLYDVNQTSSVQLVTTRDIPLVCIKATRHISEALVLTGKSRIQSDLWAQAIMLRSSATADP